MIVSKFSIKEAKSVISTVIVNENGVDVEKKSVITTYSLSSSPSEGNQINNGTMDITFTDYDAAKYFELDKEYKVTFELI